MPEPYRIAILGLDHDHVWTVSEELAAQSDAELVAAADPDAELRAKAARLRGVRTYAEHGELLEREFLHGVYVYTDNRTSAELAVEAARRGLHALVEKPMAADRVDADRMLAAARDAGTRLMINWPFAWWPQLGHAIAIAEERIGRIWQVKYRAAHEGIVRMGHSRQFAGWVENPALSGGGALVDYCCYGAVLARVVLGGPEAVIGLAGNYVRHDLEVEDNAVILMKYPRAMAIAEASWTQHGKTGAYTPTFYGEAGSILVEPRAGGRLWLADLERPGGVALEVPEPPEHQRSASAHFLWGIRTGEPFTPLCTPEMSRDAVAILDAGLASARDESRLVAVESG